MPISPGRTFHSMRTPWTIKDESWRGRRTGRRDPFGHKQRQREIQSKVRSENLLCRSSHPVSTDLLEDGMQVRFVESTPEHAGAVAEASLERRPGFTRPGKHNIGRRDRFGLSEQFVDGQITLACIVAECQDPGSFPNFRELLRYGSKSCS